MVSIEGMVYIYMNGTGTRNYSLDWLRVFMGKLRHDNTGVLADQSVNKDKLLTCDKEMGWPR